MADVVARLSTALADRYRIDKQIGRGGMATVWLARDVRHDREVAIKVLHPEVAASLGPDRFLREIRVAAKLTHPHILTLIDSGEADGLLYYVMPYVRGESLRARLLREETLELGAATAIVRDVADALHYAHRHGVVHRDVKPENVLFSEGHALVTDFGIAKAVSQASDEPLTRTGVAVGTPGYMSPEQAAAAFDIDERTDVFSLACVTYETLVGEVPARWISEEEVRQGRFMKVPAEHRARLNALPPRVSRALVRAMAVDPDDRFPTPQAFLRAMTQAGSLARRFSDTEARDILDQAATLQAEEPTGEGLSLTGVKEIGREVEIPSRHIEVAADAVARRVEREQDVASQPRVLGIPAGSHLSRTVPREIGPEEFGALLEIIQETLGEAGQIEASVGNVFAWSSGTTPGSRSSGRITRVQVSVRDGRTKISVTDDGSARVGVAVGLGTMAAGFGTLEFIDTGMPWILAAFGVVVAGGIGATLVSGRRRRRVLDRLLDRLASHVSSGGRVLPEPRDT